MRDTTDHNEKLKAPFNELNAAPTDTTKPNSWALGNKDTASFASEKNHSTANSATAMDKSEFDTVAKPL